MQSSSLYRVNGSDSNLYESIYFIFIFIGSFVLASRVSRIKHPSESTANKNEEQKKILKSARNRELANDFGRNSIRFTVLFRISQHWSCDKIHLVLVNRILDGVQQQTYILDSAVTF